MGKKESRVVFWKGNFGNMGIIISDIRVALERVRQLRGGIYLYGTGFCAKSVYYFLKEQMEEGEVKAFIQTKRTEEKVLGLPVVTVWEFSRLVQKEAWAIVAVQDKYQKEILNILQTLHISNYCGFRWNELATSIYHMQETERIRIWETFPWYRCLQDVESRLVFTYAALAKLSCDIRYYLRMQKESITSAYSEDHHTTIVDWVKTGRYLKEQENFLYVPNWAMLNYFGPRFLELGICLKGICTDDRLLQETVWRGLPIVSIKATAAFGTNVNILIGCGQRFLSYKVLDEMLALGYEKDRVLLPCSIDNPFQYGIQYFDLPELRLGSEEVFIDAGCYDCGTVQKFVEITDGHYKHIYSFEPDKVSYDHCRNTSRYKQYERFTLLNKGLWSKETNLHFSNEGTQLSRISETASHVIETTSLDQMLENEHVTIIKMDIEGAELEALRGCENIIRNQKPTLAISIYHKAEDFVDIPAYLLSLVPEYKLYYRHYSLYKYETILYAMI
ncbi:MAG: FkbM family methyltransferase [Lachnospiraceae bacterium]|nr:FkbM family methyltransferase [Lachnospiraceae bacterium]